MSTLSNAGQSVERRGFLDGDQSEPFYDPVLNAQIARLNEEIGEFTRSLRSDGPDGEELADIVIVCATIAHHLGIDLDAIVDAKCAKDEGRGYRHNGDAVPEYRFNGTLKPKPTAQHPGNVYRDFS